MIYVSEIHLFTIKMVADVDVKDICLALDSYLSFDKHFCETVKEATIMFEIMWWIFYHLNEETFILLYTLVACAPLDYANSVWALYKIRYKEQ